DASGINYQQQPVTSTQLLWIAKGQGISSSQWKVSVILRLHTPGRKKLGLLVFAHTANSQQMDQKVFDNFVSLTRGRVYQFPWV
ncbi:hypothetical protein ACQP3C_28260, partial [Escherichia coli]